MSRFLPIFLLNVPMPQMPLELLPASRVSQKAIVLLTLEKQANLIERIVEASNPRRIVLFGSAATGNRDTANDIYVLIWIENGKHSRKVEQAIYAKLLGFGLPVDVVAVTESTLQKYADSPGMIFREALTTGREL